jgi:signal transduction histidine kinase
MSVKENEQPVRMKLARQLWLLLVIPIAIGLGVYGAISHRNRHVVLMKEASRELQNHAGLVEIAVQGALERGDMEALKQRLRRLALADRTLGIAAFDERGQTILVTDHIAYARDDLAAMGKKALDEDRDVEARARFDGEPALVRTVRFPEQPGRPAIVGVVVRDLGYVDRLSAALNQWLALMGAALLALTALIAELVSRATVGRPARAIVEGAERVAAGDLEAKVRERGAEEMARLARAFNAMTAKLSDARARAEREEAERAAAEQKLRQAQALAAVGQVAASIGHEIGSPLNVILGRARRAAEKDGCPEPLRRELETIAAQSERISRVVSRLLAVARPPRAARAESDLAMVVQDVLAFLTPECRLRKVAARADLGDAPIPVGLDADRLFQVIFNLCLNALQAQPEGGAITIRLAERLNGARKVAFEVEDQGPGVPTELAEHIFDAFFTSKGDHGGTGLGLSIVSGIVREAGGTVEFVPSERCGARFRVTLPAGPPRPPLGPPEAHA